MRYTAPTAECTDLSLYIAIYQYLSQTVRSTATSAVGTNLPLDTAAYRGTSQRAYVTLDALTA